MLRLCACGAAGYTAAHTPAIFRELAIGWLRWSVLAFEQSAAAPLLRSENLHMNRHRPSFDHLNVTWRTSLTVTMN